MRLERAKKRGRLNFGSDVVSESGPGSPGKQCLALLSHLSLRHDSGSSSNGRSRENRPDVEIGADTVRRQFIRQVLTSLSARRG